MRNAQQLIRDAFVSAALALYATAGQATTFQVDTTLDAPASAAAVAAGVCDDGQGECTLRAAIEVADAAAASSTIEVPPGHYVLTVSGVDEAAQAASGGYVLAHTPDPSKGDLNIVQSMSIVGAGSAQTVIGWAPGAEQDRVFHIEVPPTAQSDLVVSLQGMTVENGYVPPPRTLDASVPTAVVRFARMGGGIAIGAGAEIQTIDSTVSEGEDGDGGGCGGGGGGGNGGCAGPEGHGGPGTSESGASIQMVTLTDVTVQNNSAGGEGGGIYNTGPLTLDHVTVLGNSSAANGGGIYNDAVMWMRDSEIGTPQAPNRAGNGGGLFETGFHTSQIERSAVLGNSAMSGGGIAARRMVLEVISRSTIADNTASDAGGGIMTNGRVELVNDTVADNTVTGKIGKAGAGLCGFGPASAQPAGGGANAANFTLVNSIVANNSYTAVAGMVLNCGGKGEGDPSARFYSRGHNLEDAQSCALNGSGDQSGVDPQLAPLSDNGGPTPTMALLPSSPAIDAADPSVCPNVDQRGQSGRADGNLDGTFACDIGAYELFVPSADLNIEAVAAPDQVFVGSTYEATATVQVDPAATGAASGVQILTMALPPVLALQDATVATPAGTVNCQQTGGAVSCPAGTLTPGASATVRLRLQALAPSPQAAILFTASQSSPVDLNPTNNSAQVLTAVLGQADLSVTAPGGTPNPRQGEVTDVPFVIRNGGPMGASQVRFGVALPSNVQFAAVDLPGGTCEFDGMDAPATILCTLDSLAAGAAVNGFVELTASGAGDGTVSFAVQAPEEDLNLLDNAAEATVSVRALSATPTGSAGGGCVTAPGSGFDPLLIAMAVGAALALARTRGGGGLG